MINFFLLGAFLAMYLREKSEEEKEKEEREIEREKIRIIEVNKVLFGKLFHCLRFSFSMIIPLQIIINLLPGSICYFFLTIIFFALSATRIIFPTSFLSFFPLSPFLT